jgi:hypothetical protein
MRTLAIVALAMISAPAVADPSATTTVRATTARPVQASGFAIASRAVDNLRIEVLDNGMDGDSHPLRVSMTDGHTFWTAPQALEAVRESCGAGKCVTTAITRETIEQADGIAWIRFELVNEIDHNDPDASDHDMTTHATAVMGCTLPHDKAGPRCAWYEPGAAQSSKLEISGTTLTVTSATGTVDKVELSFS